MKRSTLVTLLFLVGMGGYLVWSTLRSQQAECEICVEFAGQRRCATASAATELDAATQAQTAACGPLAGGMNDAIACSNRTPVSRTCSRQ